MSGTCPCCNTDRNPVLSTDAMYRILISLVIVLSTACTPQTHVNLLADGGFEESSTAWDLGCSELTPESCTGAGACRLQIETPRYTPVWADLCTQRVEVESGTEYRLSAFAKMSLPPLSNGVYIGVRRPDGSVLKDRLFLLSGTEWTRMTLDFVTVGERQLIVFCGVWADCDSAYFVDDFSLNTLKK